MKKKFTVGFFNGSASPQSWAAYLDEVSVAQFDLASQKGTSRYVAIELADGKKVQLTVTASGTAAADLTRSGDKLVISSHTPKEWELEQETGTQYLVRSKLT